MRATLASYLVTPIQDLMSFVKETQLLLLIASVIYGALIGWIRRFYV